MEHKHKVSDMDTHFVIDPITRAIKNEKNKKTTVIQFDHNSERLTFELPRYIEEHDMAECNKVEIHYINVDAITKKQNTGIYTVEDLHIEDEETVACSWLVSQNATGLCGSLSFIVRFCCVEDDVITYAWNTAVFTGISVAEGINAGEYFTGEYVDIIEQWKASVMEHFAADLTEWKAEAQAEVEQAISKEIAVERARIDALASLKDGSTTGDAELQDIRIGADGATYASAGGAVRAQIQNVVERIERVASIEIGDNLFNPSTVKNGFTISSSAGEYYEAEGSIASDYIEIAGGESYGLFIDLNGNIVSLSTTIAAVYDENKAFLQSLKFSYSSSVANDVELPEAAKYLVFVISSQHEAYVTQIMLCKGTGEIPNVIQPYFEKVVLNGCDYVPKEELDKASKRIAELENVVQKPLSGYTWGAVGDSFTAASTLGDGVKNYVDYVAEKLGLSVENYGIAGTGFVRNSNGKKNSYANRLSDALSSNCDILTVFGSFNDPQETELQSGSISIGTPSDPSDAETLCGAINKVIGIAIEKNPKCKIILFSPIPWGSYWNRFTNSEASEKIDKYNMAMAGVAARWGILYKNLTDTSNMRPWSSEFCASYYLENDSTHPNTHGHKEFIAPLVENAILEVMRK